MPFGALFRLGSIAAIALVAIAATPSRPAPAPLPRASARALPPSALSVWDGRAWREWWRSDAAPDRWHAPHDAVADAVQWRRASQGVEWGELRLAGVGEARRLRAIAVRIDPRLVRLRLDTALDNGLSFWVAGDNLWKGAALNSIQIAEAMIREGIPLRAKETVGA